MSIENCPGPGDQPPGSVNPRPHRSVEHRQPALLRRGGGGGGDRILSEGEPAAIPRQIDIDKLASITDEEADVGADFLLTYKLDDAIGRGEGIVFARAGTHCELFDE